MQTRCQARQFSDQMHCSKCGLAWDVNDPDRPACLTVKRHSPWRLKALALIQSITPKSEKKG